MSNLASTTLISYDLGYPPIFSIFNNTMSIFHFLFILFCFIVKYSINIWMLLIKTYIDRHRKNCFSPLSFLFLLNESFSHWFRELLCLFTCVFLCFQQLLPHYSETVLYSNHLFLAIFQASIFCQIPVHPIINKH